MFYVSEEEINTPRYKNHILLGLLSGGNVFNVLLYIQYDLHILSSEIQDFPVGPHPPKLELLPQPCTTSLVGYPRFTL